MFCVHQPLSIPVLRCAGEMLYLWVGNIRFNTSYKNYSTLWKLVEDLTAQDARLSLMPDTSYIPRFSLDLASSGGRSGVCNTSEKLLQTFNTCIVCDIVCYCLSVVKTRLFTPDTVCVEVGLLGPTTQVYRLIPSAS